MTTKELNKMGADYDAVLEQQYSHGDLGDEVLENVREGAIDNANVALEFLISVTEAIAESGTPSEIALERERVFA